MKITYLCHSGFSVETDSALLVFDYYKGTLPTRPNGKKLVFFVSHYHADHYNPAIFERSGENTAFVLDSTVRNAPSLPDITYVAPDKAYSLDGITVRTLRSTDCGVAFLVKIDGYTIYHAGDLHLWVWDGAPSYQNRAMHQAFAAELDKIKSEHIDIAFLPLDPRQGNDGTLGFDYAMKNLSIKHAIPMHFWGKPDYTRAFYASDAASSYREKLLVLPDEGASADILC